MIIDELSPNLLRYYKEIDQILEKDNNDILSEFRERIQDEEPKHIFIWLDHLLQQGLLPKEIDKPLTNLYGSIR